MRIIATGIAAAGVIAGCLAIALAGQRLAVEQTATIVADETTLDSETEELALQATEPDRTVEAEPLPAAPDAKLEAGTGPQRTSVYQRIAPRAPLGELGSAQLPKPKKAVPPGRWKPTRLFNPVATSAGVLEAQGYRVALSGVEPTAIEENCSFEGRSWPCGAQARTAFRAWLRARAIQCTVPPEPDRELITAECNIGKEDLSEWLVANGWARPAGGSRYGEVAEKAQAARRGMFGPPPKRVLATSDPGRPTPLNAPPVEAIPDEPAPLVGAAVPDTFPPAPAAPAN